MYESIEKKCIEKLEVLWRNYWLRFGIGSALVRPLRSWFGIGSAEPTKWRFGRSLLYRHHKTTKCVGDFAPISKTLLSNPTKKYLGVVSKPVLLKKICISNEVQTFFLYTNKKVRSDEDYV